MCVHILAVVILHAKGILSMQHSIVMCGLSLYHIFPHYVVKVTFFVKNVLNIKYVF